MRKLKEKEIPFDTIIAGNKALINSLPAPLVDRNSFYSDLDKHGFKSVISKYIKRKIDQPFTKKQKILRKE